MAVQGCWYDIIITAIWSWTSVTDEIDGDKRTYKDGKAGDRASYGYVSYWRIVIVTHIYAMYVRDEQFDGENVASHFLGMAVMEN
jgi:hypothetical protein